MKSLMLSIALGCLLFNVASAASYSKSMSCVNGVCTSEQQSDPDGNVAAASAAAAVGRGMRPSTYNAVGTGNTNRNTFDSRYSATGDFIPRRYSGDRDRGRRSDSDRDRGSDSDRDRSSSSSSSSSSFSSSSSSSSDPDSDSFASRPDFFASRPSFRSSFGDFGRTGSFGFGGAFAGAGYPYTGAYAAAGTPFTGTNAGFPGTFAFAGKRRR